MIGLSCRRSEHVETRVSCRNQGESMERADRDSSLALSVAIAISSKQRLWRLMKASTSKRDVQYESVTHYIFKKSID